jgi:hypothetical protein
VIPALLKAMSRPLNRAVVNDQALHVRFDPDIGAAVGRAPALAADQLLDLVAQRLAASAEHDLGAVAGEGDGGGAADPRGGARDQDHLSGEALAGRGPADRARNFVRPETEPRGQPGHAGCRRARRSDQERAPREGVGATPGRRGFRIGLFFHLLGFLAAGVERQSRTPQAQPPDAERAGAGGAEWHPGRMRAACG